jgi:hypothetical protein
LSDVDHLIVGQSEDVRSQVIVAIRAEVQVDFKLYRTPSATDDGSVGAGEISLALRRRYPRRQQDILLEEGGQAVDRLSAPVKMRGGF